MALRNLEISPPLIPTLPSSISSLAPPAEEAPYELEKATSYYAKPEILQLWHQMLDVSTGPEKLYQSPQFLSYLISRSSKDTSCELFVVRRTLDRAIVGFVPVRVANYLLEFHFGNKSLYGRVMRSCQILGSLPLLDPAEPHLIRFILPALLSHYKNCDFLHLQAVPQECKDALDASEGVSLYMQNGWRACHTQPIPASVDEYLAKFTSKKRYNLARQIRQLTQVAGAVELLRIETQDQVALMTNAFAALGMSRLATSEAEYTRHLEMARAGMLLSYVIRCGDEHIALLYGFRSASVWHVYNVICNQKYLHLSPGASAVHLAIQDVIKNLRLSSIDFGYGTPNADFRSTHILKMRSRILAYRSNTMTAVILRMHRTSEAINDALIQKAKILKNWYASAKKRNRHLSAS